MSVVSSPSNPSGTSSADGLVFMNELVCHLASISNVKNHLLIEMIFISNLKYCSVEDIIHTSSCSEMSACESRQTCTV